MLLLAAFNLYVAFENIYSEYKKRQKPEANRLAVHNFQEELQNSKQPTIDDFCSIVDKKAELHQSQPIKTIQWVLSLNIRIPKEEIAKYVDNLPAYDQNLLAEAHSQFLRREPKPPPGMHSFLPFFLIEVYK
eukprot:Phypoly_transcript_17567.p1 GENE.Phypoly_transcript_17567~~Phypoly_transcript_17567.p1  ORF type:complete len:132 (+),score=20.11 Phypoly_transcript_17567:372-767(+)